MAAAYSAGAGATAAGQSLDQSQGLQDGLQKLADLLGQAADKSGKNSLSLNDLVSALKIVSISLVIAGVIGLQLSGSAH